MNADEERYLIALRRELHAHPELGGQEHRTANRVAEELEKMGLEVVRGLGGTGVVGVLHGALPGKCRAYRADMDALPVCEPEGLDFGSRHPGLMHACGHDVHCTIALGIARYLAPQRPTLRGRIVFVFQPNEEGAPGGGTGGAQAMTDDGLLERFGLEAIYAMHCKPDLAVGQLGYTRGGAWASCDHFALTMRGQQTHGAYPHLGRDPIAAAAEVVQSLCQIPSRRIDARKPCVVSVGTIHAGEAYNIIPEVAHLEGIVRALDREVRRRANEALAAIAHGVAAAHGISAELEIHAGAEVTVNDDALLDHALAVLRPKLGAALLETPPQMGAEDFSVFAALIPGLYLQIGVREPSRDFAPLHSPHFFVNEQSIAFGVEAMASVLLADAGCLPSHASNS